MKLKRIISLLLCGLLVVGIPVEVINASVTEVGTIIEDDGENEEATVTSDEEENTTETDSDMEDGSEENNGEIEATTENPSEEDASVEVGNDKEASSGKAEEKTSFTTNRMRSADIEINEINFPDEYFRSYVGGFDVDKDGKLSIAEREDVERLFFTMGKLNMVSIRYLMRLEACKELGSSPI